MAGPSVVVRVLGDLKGLSGSVDQAASKGAGAASKLRGAFTGTLSALNRTGVLGPFSDALAGVDTALSQVSEHGKGLGATMLGVGGTMAGVGVALSALGSHEKASHEQLKQAVENTGHAYEDYAKQIDAASKHNERFGITSHTTNDALRILTQATHDPAKALQLMSTATDLAAAKNEDLTTAATQVGRAYNGATKIFKEFGITAAPKAAVATKALATATKAAAAADDHARKARQNLADYMAVYSTKAKHTVADQIRLRNETQKVADADAKAREAHLKMASAQDTATKATRGQATNMAALAKVVHGQADRAANTFTGHLKALGATVTDAAARFGEKFGPAITVGGTALAGLGGAMTATSALLQTFRGAQEAAAVATEATAAAEDTAAVSSWAMLGPILLVIAAVAALVVAGYVIYRNWSTIWHGIQAAIAAVWNWIKTNWPLLLGILLGPIGVAVVLIVRNWNTIRDAIAGVVNWIRSNWPLLLAILTGPIGIAVLLISRYFSNIVGAVGVVVGGIRAAWDGLVGFFAGLPGRLAGIFSGMWNGITDAFRDAINAVIDLWNALHFTLPKVSFLGKSIGGNSVGVPHIPHLAQGGVITASGLIYAHAGEAITPAPARAAPSVWIEQATFRETLDVDAFLRRAAWAVQREGI